MFGQDIKKKITIQVFSKALLDIGQTKIIVQYL